MLMVATTEPVVHWVHGNWPDAWEDVSLGLVLVPLDTGLQDRLVDSAAASHDSDHGSALSGHGLSVSTGQSDPDLVAFLRATNNDGRGAGAASELSLVVNDALHVADNGTIRDGRQRQNVANSEGGLLADVDVLAGVHAFSGNEVLSTVLVVVRVAEENLRERRPAAWVVDDLLHHSAEVSKDEAGGLTLRARRSPGF